MSCRAGLPSHLTDMTSVVEAVWRIARSWGFPIDGPLKARTLEDFFGLYGAAINVLEGISLDWNRVSLSLRRKVGEDLFHFQFWNILDSGRTDLLCLIIRTKGKCVLRLWWNLTTKEYTVAPGEYPPIEGDPDWPRALVDVLAVIPDLAVKLIEARPKTQEITPQIRAHDYFLDALVAGRRPAPVPVADQSSAVV